MVNIQYSFRVKDAEERDIIKRLLAKVSGKLYKSNAETIIEALKLLDKQEERKQ